MSSNKTCYTKVPVGESKLGKMLCSGFLTSLEIMTM